MKDLEELIKWCNVNDCHLEISDGSTVYVYPNHLEAYNVNYGEYGWA